MRIALSGSHHTGKTTLIGELAAALPAYDTVDEPYYLLEDEGHAFAETPGAEDYALQLERSLQAIAESGDDTLFDRCPLDFLAYLAALDEPDAFDADRLLPELGEAMRRLDLIVFVPIEDPDRMDESDRAELRRRVDDELRDLILDDPWGFGVPVIEVSGSPDERARRVLAHIRV